jgi:hypothetical protein
LRAQQVRHFLSTVKVIYGYTYKYIHFRYTSVFLFPPNNGKCLHLKNAFYILKYCIFTESIIVHILVEKYKLWPSLLYNILYSSVI